MSYLYITGTIAFTVYGQIIIKWRINSLGWAMSHGSIFEIIKSYLGLIFDPFIISGLLSAFIASLLWMLAMTKLELTHAYPFMSLSPAIVFLLGVFFLNETFTLGKVIGLVLIALGIIATVKL